MKCFKIAFLTFLISFVALPPFSLLFGADPDVKQIASSSINYRLEHTKRGFVRMRVSNEIHPAQQSEFLYEILFDDKRIQQIRRCRLLGRETWGKPEKIVVTPRIYIHDVEYLDTAVQVNLAKSYDNAQEHFHVINPRILGMVRNGANMLHVFDIEDLLNRSNPNATLHSVEMQGAAAWRIDYQRTKEGGSDASIWIIPDQGFSVARIELRFVQNGKQFVQTTDSRMKQFPQNDVWYPERVVRTDTLDGAVLLRQVVHVEDARFGEAIDDSVFSLSGLTLKPGRQIVDSTSGLPWGKVWNGKEAVDPSGVKPAPANPVRHWRPRWLQLALGVGLGLFAAIYFWRAFRRRRSASNPGS